MPHHRARAATVALILFAAAAPIACERRAAGDNEDARPLVTLTVETPEALAWGSTGLLRLSLTNEGEAVAPGAFVEVFVPDWLEFGTVEPTGLAVTVSTLEGETRLVYPFPDSLQPGERVTVRQHLRVQHQPPLPPAPGDTVDTVTMAPVNQTVRARLLTLEGVRFGAEVQATLTFVAEPPPLAPPETPPVDTVLRDTLPPDTLPPPRDTVPPG